MNKKANTINWSDEQWREKLEAPRRFLWREDTLDMLADWMKMSPGMTTVDVGCGLGYLGYTYWSYFGTGGAYFGIDENLDLLSDAQLAAKDWAVGGKACFSRSDVYNIPLADNFSDFTMCQTLMIHLKYPEKALNEMVRITKPGGLVVCKEPDNLSSRLERGHNSLPIAPLEEEIQQFKLTLLCYYGRIKLGLGDDAIGNRIPRMMKKIGLYDVDARINDKVWRMEPPYEEDEQRHAFNQAVANLDKPEQDEEYWNERTLELFLAGGGKRSEFESIVATTPKWKEIARSQIENKELYSCGAGPFYIIKGRKPE